MQDAVFDKSGGVLEFCTDLCRAENDSTTVLAIARKMPRLLEFSGSLDDTKCNVITERALPWLTSLGPSGCQLRAADDVLNVGSTISHYVKYALKRFPNVSAEIQIYAKRESKSTTRDRFPPTPAGVKTEVRESFDERTYWRFETSLPVALLSLGKPYDVDFPIIHVPLSAADCKRTSDEWVDILSEQFASVHNVTIASQRTAGITSISAFEPLRLDYPLVNGSCGATPPSKVRIYISAAEQVARIVPMCIPVVQKSDLKHAMAGVDDAIKDIFDRLQAQAAEGEPFPLEPIYNLLVYLTSFDYGRLFLPHFDGVLHDANQQAFLSFTDIKFIFGETIGRQLLDTLTQILREPPRVVSVADAFPQVPVPEKPLNSQLVSEVIQDLKKQGFSGAGPERVFRETMRVLDKIAGANNPDDQDAHLTYKRLRRGIALHDLWLIAATLSPNRLVSIEEVSFLLDYYVDIGAVVPVVEELGDVYLRSYRRGEADPLEFAKFINKLLLDHAKLFPESPLNVTQFTKILAALAVLHPGKTPLLPMFEYRGTVPFIPSDDTMKTQVEEAVGFLQRKHAVRLESPSPKTDQRELF